LEKRLKQAAPGGRSAGRFFYSFELRFPKINAILHKISHHKLCKPTKMQFSEKTFKKPVRKWAKKLFIYVEGIPCIKTAPLTEVQKFGIIDAKSDVSKRKEYL
jgi:hypothetical protein